MRIALFPGSFDPITLAHVDVVKRAQSLFDKIYIAVGTNSEKAGLIPIDRRLAILSAIFSDNPNIAVSSYQGLTVDYAKNLNARFILRGLRSISDFEYEKPIAQNNQSLAPDIQTVFLMSRPELSHISSTIVREIHRYKGAIHDLVPQEVLAVLNHTS